MERRVLRPGELHALGSRRRRHENLHDQMVDAEGDEVSVAAHRCVAQLPLAWLSERRNCEGRRRCTEQPDLHAVMDGSLAKLMTDVCLDDGLCLRLIEQERNEEAPARERLLIRLWR